MEEINGLAIPDDAATAIRAFAYACREWGGSGAWMISQATRDAEGELIGVVSRLESDRQAFAAECERMRPVVEAARQVQVANSDGPHPFDLRIDTTLSYLQRSAIAAIIDALMALTGPGSGAPD